MMTGLHFCGLKFELFFIGNVTQLFYNHHTGRPVLISITVENWSILLEHSFTACIPLMTSTNEFELGRRS